ncbi:mediator of rna polymerase ii transcription [Lynx pardinus]|uniref:Mediator of RNA polymerase II transcription subunit 31 n=1 Tax=Lynx pardinus TaxID=191816 RepID=A0A485N9E8_LYNPA|nr:mediator of rna polymerase ii transcription [Lynx pardinus]
MAAAVAMETDISSRFPGDSFAAQLQRGSCPRLLPSHLCRSDADPIGLPARPQRQDALLNRPFRRWFSASPMSVLKYPQCLHMLELLQYEHFRKELVNAQCAKFIDEQQILHWQHYSRKRMRLQQALAEQQQQNNAAGK